MRALLLIMLMRARSIYDILYTCLHVYAICYARRAYARRIEMLCRFTCLMRAIYAVRYYAQAENAAAIDSTSPLMLLRYFARHGIRAACRYAAPRFAADASHAP